MAVSGRAQVQRPGSKKRKAVLSAMAPGRAQKPLQAASPKAGSPKAPDLAPVDPCSVGVDAGMLREYEGAMQEMVKQGAIPGCASVVFVKGQVVHVGSWGYADLERGTRFKLDTLCRLYCMTKSYVAITFMTLVDEGRASLEDRLDKYLPAFANMRVKAQGPTKSVKAESPIRLKHLLSHTSGIDYAPDLSCEPEDDAAAAYLALQKLVQQGSVRTLEDFVQRLAKLPLSNHPGKGYYYGYSMDVLARVVEVIMGKELDQCLRERLFEPLGMHDTLWAVPDSQLHRLAAIYGGPGTWGGLYGGVEGQAPVTTRNGLLRIDGTCAEESNWREGQQCSVLSGGGFMGYLKGGLVSTVADTVRFVRMVMKRGLMENGQRLLQESTAALMERDRLKLSWGSGRACYLGNVGVFREGEEFGMGGAACTYWSIDREDDVATVWFTQHVDMPEFDDLKGVDPAKADLWKLLHVAVRSKTKAGKRKSMVEKGNPPKQRRISVGKP